MPICPISGNLEWMPCWPVWIQCASLHALGWGQRREACNGYDSRSPLSVGTASFFFFHCFWFIDDKNDNFGKEQIIPYCLPSS